MNASASSRSLTKAVVLGALICGTLDIADAIVFYWLRGTAKPTRLLQNIASVPFGPHAFAGGLPMAATGLLIHYCIAAFWVCVFILLAERIAWMFRNAIAAGLLYGLVVFAGMNMVLLPLFHRPFRLHFTVDFFNAVLALVLFIGLPAALINRRYAPLPATLR